MIPTIPHQVNFNKASVTLKNKATNKNSIGVLAIQTSMNSGILFLLVFAEEYIREGISTKSLERINIRISGTCGWRREQQHA